MCLFMHLRAKSRDISAVFAKYHVLPVQTEKNQERQYSLILRSYQENYDMEMSETLLIFKNLNGSWHSDAQL